MNVKTLGIEAKTSLQQTHISINSVIFLNVFFLTDVLPPDSLYIPLMAHYSVTKIEGTSMARGLCNLPFGGVREFI